MTTSTMTTSAQSQSKFKPPEAMFKYLRTATSTLRLNQIEKIRANGVGELVALPQLVVCGDQSAGKSSVLEAITGIPFPRQEGLCTRFPTEIILRHSGQSESTTITATIRPSASRTQDDRLTMSAYRKTVEAMTELQAIIDQVSRLMRLRNYTDDGSGPAFASDSLRIEIVGPIGLHLSIVDLPGLISVPNEEQTQDDVEAVHAMVRAYLSSSRTIILAVLQAGNDMANQPIIKLIREYDETGERAVGIITKPDLINAGAEADIARVSHNQGAIRLKLGFFLLKNPTPLELKGGISMEFRAKREREFFESPAWNSLGLDPERVGAEKLRSFLQDLLDAHIERELPKVRHDINKHLDATKADLRAMGDARPTVGHIRSFLTQLSMSFYELSQAALEGNYHTIDAEFFSSEDGVRRLRARLQSENTKFAASVRERGQRRKIGLRASSTTSDYEPANKTAQLIVSESEMMEWVKKVYRRTRGTELPGNHNPSLLFELFREQSRPWRDLAVAHVTAMADITSQWLSETAQRLIKEENPHREVKGVLVAWLSQAKQLAREELNKLLLDEERAPMTYNHYYTDNLQNARLDDQKAKVKKAVEEVAQFDWNGKLHIANNTDDINRFIAAIKSHITVDMDEQACKEALTQLNAYYKVAMKTFVDNIARQVIERHIIAPLPRAFCPDNVASLSNEDLVRIGSEPKQQIVRRDKLNGQMSSLRESLVELGEAF